MKKVLVIGDSMIDKFVYGNVDRISPEAPAMVFDITDEKRTLGGACNVAANIRTLSGLSSSELKIEYFGFYSPFISEEFSELYDVHCTGTQEEDDFILSKTRYVTGNNHQLLRVDNKKKYERCVDKDNFPLDKGYDLIVISDYNKNSIDVYWDDILKYNAPIIFDLKILRSSLTVPLQKYGNKCILKCNEKESIENKLYDPKNVDLYKAVIETRGSKGFMLYTKDFYHYGKGIKIDGDVDPTGAGDVFLAGMAVKYFESNGDLKEMCYFANSAAAEKVKNKGTFSVRRKLLNV